MLAPYSMDDDELWLEARQTQNLLCSLHLSNSVEILQRGCAYPAITVRSISCSCDAGDETPGEFVKAYCEKNSMVSPRFSR